MEPSETSTEKQWEYHGTTYKLGVEKKRLRFFYSFVFASWREEKRENAKKTRIENGKKTRHHKHEHGKKNMPKTVKKPDPKTSKLAIHWEQQKKR